MKCGECEHRIASAIENGCPSYTSPDRMQPETAAACRPMTRVAELEAGYRTFRESAEAIGAEHLEKIERLEAERDRLVSQHMDCTALRERDEARAEAAKWERAAWELATILHQAARIEHADDTITTLTVPQSESEWIERALSAPQAQEEEKP